MPPQVAVQDRILPPDTVIVPLVIRVGREDPNSQPEPNTCSFGILGDLPPQVRLGSTVDVYLAHGYGGVWTDIWEDDWSPDLIVATDEPTERITRFAGTITDLSPESVGGVLQTGVVATGRMGDLGRIKTGTTNWPVETEKARVERLATEAEGAGIDVVGEGYTWQMAARPLETASVLDILYDTCTAGGLLHESPEGTIQFDHWQVREEGEATAFLIPTDIEDSVGWSQQVSAFIRRAVVRYGTPAEGNSEQPQVVVGPRGWGQPEQVISTFLNTAADATTFAKLVLSRWGDTKQFEAPTLVIPAHTIPTDTWDAIMGLGFGAVIVTEGVTAFPVALPQGRNEWFVEGWTEEYDRPTDALQFTHMVNLSVSDRARFRPDLGGVTMFTDLQVGPSEAPYGTVRQFVGRLRHADTSGNPGVGVVGYVEVQNGRETLGAAQTDSDGYFTVVVRGDALPYGSYLLTAVYSGNWPTYKGTVGQFPPTVVTGSTTVTEASIGLTTSPVVANAGQPVTLTATVGMTRNQSTAGRVTFQYRTDVNGAWTTLARVDLKRGQVKAKATWKAAPPVPGGAGVYSQVRAVYNPTLAGVADVNTGPVGVPVRIRKTKTLNYNGQWDESYGGNGVVWPQANIQFGQHATKGNSKGLIGFGLEGSDDWIGWTISKVEVYLKAGYWANNIGTMRIGSHPYNIAPTGQPEVQAGKTIVSNWKEGQGRWVNITPWGKGICTGVMGVALGPGGGPKGTKPGDPKFRGWVYPTSDAVNGPKLRVNGYRWEMP